MAKQPVSRSYLLLSSTNWINLNLMFSCAVLTRLIVSCSDFLPSFCRSQSGPRPLSLNLSPNSIKIKHRQPVHLLWHLGHKPAARQFYLLWLCPRPSAAHHRHTDHRPELCWRFGKCCCCSEPGHWDRLSGDTWRWSPVLDPGSGSSPGGDDEGQKRPGAWSSAWDLPW